MSLRRRTALLLALFMGLPLVGGRAHAASRSRPALLVILVIDQMRADYRDRFGHQWQGGLARLFDEGAWYRQAAYPYLQTVTCAGHATISTGSWPRHHGIVLNGWWDRQQRKILSCTHDDAAPVTDGKDVLPSGESARHLLVPTLSDRMRTQISPAPRIVTLAVKTRSSIMMAGHRADLAGWFSGTKLVTSTALSPTVSPLLSDLGQRFAVNVDDLPPWTRALPPAAYHFRDDGEAENPPAGWTKTFPHPLTAPEKAVSLARWTASPAADRHILELAAAAVTDMKLGHGKSPDYLTVSLSALDYVGHSFGPRSHEAQDVLIRLDRALDDFLKTLDREVGKGRYTVALSADHGGALLPEQLRDLGLDAGRIDRARLNRDLEDTLHELLAGRGGYVDRIEYTDVYFSSGVYQQIVSQPHVMEKVLATVKAVPGVADAFFSHDLRSVPGPDQPLKRAAALSHHADRSGELILAPKDRWITVSAGSTHGTASADDQRVPVVFFGAGIRPGRYDQPISPADIAPTMGHLVGVTMPGADGRVLSEVLK